MGFGVYPDDVNGVNIISGQGGDWRLGTSHKRFLEGSIPSPATIFFIIPYFIPYFPYCPLKNLKKIFLFFKIFSLKKLIFSSNSA